MRYLFLNIIFLFVLSFLAPASFAADANRTDWQFDVAPYLWAINMDGSVTQGPLTTHISEDFSQLMRQFDGGGMLWLDAYKGPLGFFINGLYSDLNDNNNNGTFDADLKTHFGIVSGGVSYIVFQRPWASQHLNGQIQFEPYLGARYTFNNVNISYNHLKDTSDHGWTDIIIGLRYRNDFNTHWVITLSGDVGGKNTSTQYSYNLIGLVGYKPTHPAFDNYTLYIGYRYLYQHEESGEGLDFFEWRMKLFGPMVGINFSF